MENKHECPDCGKDELKYGLVTRQRPMFGRVLIIGVGVSMLLGPLMYPVGEAIYRYIAIFFGGLILYGSFNEAYNIHKTVTSVRFQCVTCSHEWDIEKEGVPKSEIKWEELPIIKWKKVVSGKKILELEK